MGNGVNFRKMAVDLRSELTRVEAERDALRAQLANWQALAAERLEMITGRDALLRDLDEAWNAHDGEKLFGKLMMKVEALSASAEPSAPVESDELTRTTLDQVLRAYHYAMQHPHKYLTGTTNWCAAVAHSLNDQARADLERKP